MNDIEQSDPQHPSVLLRYLRFAKPYRLWLVFVIIAGVGKFCVPLFLAYLTGQQLVDRVLMNSGGLSPAGQYDLLMWIGVGMGSTVLLESAMIFLRGAFTVKIVTAISFDIRYSLWKHLQRLSLGFHQSRPTGTILSRLMSDVSQAQQMVNAGIVNVGIDGISGIVALVILFSLSWQLTLIVIGVLPLYGLMYRLLNPRLRQASHDVQEQTSVMSGQAIERLGGIAVIQSFAQEKDEQRAFGDQADELRGKTVRRGVLNNILQSLNNILVSGMSGAIWIVGALLALRGGTITVGELIQYTATAGVLYLPVRRFSEINIMFQQSMAAAERVFAIFDIVPEVREAPEPVRTPPQQGGIEFRDVHFRYRPELPDVLTGLNVSVAPGERIAVVGESGAGKSTLATLIPRLYDVTGGAILLDGLDIREYRLKTLRRSIGIVLQESILFSGTIHENLRYGRKDADWEQILEAAKLANCHAFIESLPEGYNTEIGERGTSLSGGQKQRISIARTILQDPKILIFDEATSALDSESENLITEAMERVMKGRTSLVIAHRLSTIMGADRILAMRAGRIVEQGPHEELLRRGGYYRYLFEQQFGPMQELIKKNGLTE